MAENQRKHLWRCGFLLERIDKHLIFGLMFLGSEQTELLEDIALDESLDYSHHLIVWNDDVNTFDWVIETLMAVCGHDFVQAEQCSMLIHFNGKCSVKTGDFNTLKPMCEAILDRGIQASIEDQAK